MEYRHFQETLQQSQEYLTPAGEILDRYTITEAQMESVFGAQYNCSLNSCGLRALEIAVVTLLQSLNAAAKQMLQDCSCHHTTKGATSTPPRPCQRRGNTRRNPWVTPRPHQTRGNTLFKCSNTQRKVSNPFCTSRTRFHRELLSTYKNGSGRTLVRRPTSSFCSATL